MPSDPPRVPNESLRGMFQPPGWVTGGLSLGDAAFLVELVHEQAPTTVVEVGVAAGTSSAALLFALDHLPAVEGGRLLYSVDVNRQCYFDPRRPIGAAVAEMYPRRASTAWALHTGVDARMGATRIASAIDLAFVDANHHHPYPLLDVVHLASVMRPGAWIAVHDIALARLYPQFQSHGAEWLFAAWPGPTRRGAAVGQDGENIGAVQLPADARALVAPFKALLARPWEQTPTLAEVSPLPGCFAALEGAVLARRRRARPVGVRR